MDELTALEDLGAALDPPRPQPPASLRTRVLASLTDTASAHTAVPARLRWPAPRRTARRRLTLAAVVTVSLAAALVALPTLRVSGGQPPASAQAKQILTRAAATAASTPVLAAHAGQYVYVKSYLTPSAAVSVNGAGSHSPDVREVWLSVDGTGTGLVTQTDTKTGTRVLNEQIPGCVHGMRPAAALGAHGLDGKPSPCTPDPAYRVGLPTTVSAMRAFIYGRYKGLRATDGEAFKIAADLIRESYVPPASLAALFGAVAQIPGARVQQNVTDAAGRTAVAVVSPTGGRSYALLFDPASYRYLGQGQVFARGAGADGASSQDFAVAVLKIAIVANVGQRP